MLKDGTAGVGMVVALAWPAIDAADPELAAELEAVSAAKKAAALFYLTPERFAEKADQDAVASRFDRVNQVTERILAEARKSGASDVIALGMDGRQVSAARTESTGGFVVLAHRRS